MGRDSNPWWTLAHSGFQDRRLRPLGHPSIDWQDPTNVGLLSSRLRLHRVGPVLSRPGTCAREGNREENVTMVKVITNRTAGKVGVEPSLRRDVVRRGSK